MKMVKTVILVVAIFMVGCTSVLDKKFDLKTAKDDYAKIKSEYSDKYTPDELNALTNAMVGQTITGGNTTYRELLDTIQAARIRYDTAMSIYKKSLEKLQSALNVKVTATEAKKGNYGIGDYWKMHLIISNTSGLNISAYKGAIDVHSLTGTHLGTFNQESSNTMLVAENVNESNWWPIFRNEALFYESTTDKLKFTWSPQVIIFEDGNKMQAPQMPQNPFE